MKLGFGRGAFGIGLGVVMLAGCGGSQGQSIGMTPQGSTGTTPGRAQKASGSYGDLLYAAADARIEVYSFPAGVLINSFAPPELPVRLCGDSNGDVFVATESVSGPAFIYEYAHGGSTPIATIQDGSASNPYRPESCTVDPTTGNLAVVNNIRYTAEQNVAVFPNAQEPPTLYDDSAVTGYTFCTYDEEGNLYVAGYQTYDYGPRLSELKRGDSAFIGIKVNHLSRGGPGTLQWFGGYLAYATLRGFGGKVAHDAVQLIKITGSKGTIVGRTRFHGGQPWMWIQGNIMIGPHKIKYGRGIAYWSYPAGGEPIKVIRRPLYVSSVLVSVGPSGSHIRQ